MKPQIGPNTDLETILEAWQEATMRLQSTHESLRYEVSRLTDELEVKNRELARKNRLADLGQMASHVAHEVRNSLVPMTLYLSLLRRRLVDTPRQISRLEAEARDANRELARANARNQKLNTTLETARDRIAVLREEVEKLPGGEAAVLQVQRSKSLVRDVMPAMGKAAWQWTPS